MAEDQIGPSLDELTATITEQNKALKNMESLGKLDTTIKAMEKSNTENSVALREQFNSIQTALQTAENDEQLELAREQLEALEGLAGTEEENREAAKRQEEANYFLEKQLEGINKFADGFDKFVDNLAPSAGLFATLGGLALLFTDPETLFAGVRAAIDGVYAIIDSIKMGLEGDISGALSLLGDNFGAIAGILGTLGILFSGTIIRAFGGIFKGIQLVVRGIQAFRLFMLGTFVPSMIGFFSTISAAVAPILVAAAPFIAIGALVAAGVYAIYEAFQKAKDVFDETGSITETMVTFATDIVTAPIRWIKNLSAWILSKLGFEELATKLNNFDITKTITDTVMGTIEWIKGVFTDPVAALEKLAVALLGVDGLLGVITAPIDKGIAWVQGLFNLGDPSRPFSLYDTLYNPIDKTITWLQGLFTDPVTALQQAWNGLVGEGGLVDILISPVDKAIAWIQGLFSWGDPTEPFKLSTVVKDAFNSAKEWVVGLFTWGSEAGTGEDGTWTLSTFVTNAFADVKKWMLDKFAFASNIATEGWTNLKDFVSTKFVAVKDWFTGLFSWASEGLSEGWTNLTDFVKGKWTATKEWFTGMFAWSSDESEKGVIQTLFDDTIEKIKTFFTDLFDFLPTFEEIKAVLTGLLPDWMQPDSIQEQRDSIQAEIDSQRAEMASGDMRNWRGKLRSEIIEELQGELASLPQLNYGGIVSAPKSGTPVMLHGEEIVTPLNSPQGQVLMAINELMNAKAATGTGEYGSPSAAAIVMGGNTNKSNTNNVNTTNYTIQQGVTPDDFLKRDFLNFSY
jgi:hypothetical protein